MAYNVKFLKGTADAFNNLAAKDANTFYYVGGTDLYLGEIKLSNAAELQAAITRIAANEEHIGNVASLTTAQKANLVAAINELKSEVSALTGGESGGISDMIEAVTGDLSTLTTEAKGTLVAAINEVDGNVDALKTSSTVSISESSTDANYSKVYTVKQGTTTVGTINIPKDMVVRSGAVETKTEAGAWGEAGTYIVLTLANATSDKIYVNVGTLVDIYTIEANATQIQLAMNGREISASIVDGSVNADALAADAVVTAKIKDGNVTADKLAADSVLTAKIKDKNVTKAKLEQAVQDSLGKADSAVQAVVEGTDNGTIKVDNVAVKVHGLGDAAYKAASAFDASGAAATAKSEVIGNVGDAASADTIKGAKAYADSLAGNYATAAQGTKADSALQAADIASGSANGTIAVKGTNVAVKGLGSAAYASTDDFDGKGSATTALNNAKAYTDTALTWGTIA